MHCVTDNGHVTIFGYNYNNLVRRKGLQFILSIVQPPHWLHKWYLFVSFTVAPCIIQGTCKATIWRFRRKNMQFLKNVVMAKFVLSFTPRNIQSTLMYKRSSFDLGNTIGFGYLSRLWIYVAITTKRCLCIRLLLNLLWITKW